MKRALLVVCSVAVALPVAILLLGGLNFWSEVKYVESSSLFGVVPSVNLQNSRSNGWGSSQFISYSDFGAPYELVITGTFAANTGITELEIRDLRVEANGSTVLAIDKKHLTLAIEVTRQDGVWTEGRGFTVSWEGLLGESPERVTVSGILMSRSVEKRKDWPFKSEFNLVRARELSLGSRTIRF